MAMDYTRLAEAAMGGLGRRKPEPPSQVTIGINPGGSGPGIPPMSPSTPPIMPGPADMPKIEGKRSDGKPVPGIEAPNWLAKGLGKMAEIKTESDAPPAPVINFTPQAPVQAQYQAQPVMQTPFAPPQPDPMAQKKMFEDMLRGWIGMRG